MARPTMPTTGSTAWATGLNNAVFDVSDRADQALAAVTGVPAVVQVTSFAGSTDAAKMQAAMTYANAQTYRPWIQLPAREFNTGTTSFDMYNGMKICGPGIAEAPKNPEAGGGAANQTGTWRTTCGTGANSLLRCSTTIQSVAVVNVSFHLPSGASQVFRASGGNGLYPSVFHNLNMYGGPYFFGNPSEKFLTTQMVFSGHWQCTVQGDTPFTLGGGDASLWMSGYANLDSGPGAGAGKPIIHFSSMSKSNVGFMYITNRADWTGVRITGSGTHELSFFGGAYEGYSAPNSTRPIIDVQGGTNNFYGLYTGQVASTATSLGAIHQSGGMINWYGGTYNRDEAPVAFPFLYQTGGTARFYGLPQSTLNEQIRIRWSTGVTDTYALHANGVVL